MLYFNIIIYFLSVIQNNSHWVMSRNLVPGFIHSKHNIQLEKFHIYWSLYGEILFMYISYRKKKVGIVFVFLCWGHFHHCFFIMSCNWSIIITFYFRAKYNIHDSLQWSCGLCPVLKVSSIYTHCFNSYYIFSSMQCLSITCKKTHKRS